jgi:HD-like signal output (HDOD) protein
VGSDPVLSARLLKVANSNFANRSGAQIKDLHTGIGHAMLEAWGFSEEMANTANEHEDLQRPHTSTPDVTDVVITANLCAYWSELGDTFDWSEVTAAKRLKLDHDAIGEILKESQEEIQSVMQALG